MSAPTLTSLALEDLRRSGLTDETIELAQIGDPTSNPIYSEYLRQAHVALGYVIPYFTTEGTLLKGFRRIRSFDPDKPKYRQPAGSQNHAYIPPLPLMPNNWAQDPSVDLVITEGEKKALASSQYGWPTIGLGGVDSWITTVHDLNPTKAKPKTEPVAEFAAITWEGRTVYIVFDNDKVPNRNVQMSAFRLANYLKTRGARVTQVRLPAPENGYTKVGLDDLLRTDEGREWFAAAPTDLVLPPNTREWVKARLNEKRLSRDDKEEIAETLLIALDRDGTRYVNPDTKDYYYFENATKVLHPFRFDQVSQLRTSSFGALLASKYGIKTADTEVVSRLADGFIAFPPIESTAPRRAVHASDDAVYYQISDGEIAKVTRHGLEIVPNGTDSVLFLPDQVVPLNSRSLVEAYDKASKYALNPRWLETLETVNLVALEPLTLDETRVLLTCLFYMSPWLAHWRELQAPMEIAVAEGGSGKTMLYNLRMGILTGDQSLAGLPDDFRSWTAAVTAAPGMWVCDNLAAVRTDYWHQLNGAIANLVTDTDPRISTRTLYTTASLSKIPVRATFAVTTIKNPFTAPDILGRSIVYQLQAVPVGQRDANWVSRRLKEREAWVVEELIVLSRFLALAHRRWDEEYQSGHRLKHFEQAILLLGEVLGLSVEDIVPRLPEVTSTSVAEYDPIIEALKAFTEEWESPNARLADVVEWVQADVDSRFSAIKTLGNVILLGRYIKSHQADIKGATGIEVVVRHNATLLRLTTLAGDDDEA